MLAESSWGELLEGQSPIDSRGLSMMGDSVEDSILRIQLSGVMMPMGKQLDHDVLSQSGNLLMDDWGGGLHSVEKCYLHSVREESLDAL